MGVSGFHSTVSYALPILTFPWRTDRAPFLKAAEFGSAGEPFIMTICPPSALSPMASRSARPWISPTFSPSKET